MTEKTWDQILLDRRTFIERILLVGLGAWSSLSVINMVAAVREPVLSTQPLTAPNSPVSSAPDAKVPESVRSEEPKLQAKPEEHPGPSELPKQEDYPSLSALWTRHWLVAKELPEKNYAVNEKLFSKQAAEALDFAVEVKNLLRDPAVKMRLIKIAQLTDLGKISPPSPTPERLASTDRKTSFVSPFFGPQEFLNLKQSRLVRTNLAVPVVIGLIENTSESYLHSRLIGLPTGQNWNSQYNWDAFNAHVGLDAGRFLTGQKNSDVADYGPDSRGNVLANVAMRKSMGLDDRLQVMLQPFILAIRSLNYNRSARDIEMADNDGNVTGVGQEILRRYNSRDDWKRRFTEMYKGLWEFCEKFPAYKWILTESIV